MKFWFNKKDWINSLEWFMLQMNFIKKYFDDKYLITEIKFVFCEVTPETQINRILQINQVQISIIYPDYPKQNHAFYSLLYSWILFKLNNGLISHKIMNCHTRKHGNALINLKTNYKHVSMLYYNVYFFVKIFLVLE